MARTECNRRTQSNASHEKLNDSFFSHDRKSINFIESRGFKANKAIYKTLYAFQSTGSGVRMRRGECQPHHRFYYAHPILQPSVLALVFDAFCLFGHFWLLPHTLSADWKMKCWRQPLSSCEHVDQIVLAHPQFSLFWSIRYDRHTAPISTLCYCINVAIVE